MRRSLIRLLFCTVIFVLLSVSAIACGQGDGDDDVLPDITVTKTANLPASVPETGGNVTFTYTVANNGTEAATITGLSDDRFGPLAGDADCYVGAVLAPGQTVSFEATFAVPAGDYPGSHVNVFTATVSDGDGNTDTATDNATVDFTEDVYALWKAQPNQRIVFMSKADSDEGELYLLDKAGQITRLTNNTRHENNPALSADGKKVAFNAGDASNQLTWDIYVLDLDTKQETRLTNNSVIDAPPDWSPDGSKIVFGSFRNAPGNPAGTADIYVMNADGTGLKQLTNTPWEDNDPEWSPDGTKIVFKSTRDTQTSAREEIYTMNSDGSDAKRLTQTSGWQSDHDPSWSPGSDKVVFIRFEGSRPWTDTANFADDWEELTPWNVHVVDLNGNVQRLTNNDTAGWGVTLFSADATKILYGRIDWITNSGGQVIGGNHRLILMDTDGSNQKQLIPDDRHTGTLEYFDW